MRVAAQSGQGACRLVLGTAQIGQDYGIANQKGRPQPDEVLAIVKRAVASGIDVFDTAQAYGQSEGVLGTTFQRLELCDSVRVITKINPACDHLDPIQMNAALAQSMASLGVRRLFGAMLHGAKRLSQWSRGIGQIMAQWLKNGQIRHAGVSVPTPADALMALGCDRLSMIQLPTNILDRRFEKAGVFELARRRETSIFIRSVFLQGLILMPPEKIPAAMDFARPVIRSIGLLADSEGLTVGELALGYVLCAFGEASIVVGVESEEQLAQLVKLSAVRLPATVVQRARKAFADVPDHLLNPALWPRIEDLS